MNEVKRQVKEIQDRITSVEFDVKCNAVSNEASVQVVLEVSGIGAERETRH